MLLGAHIYIYIYIYVYIYIYITYNLFTEPIWFPQEYHKNWENVKN